MKDIKSKDELEEENLIERCVSCKSINIKEEYINDIKMIWCSDCGCTDYTELIELEEYVTLNLNNE